MNINRADNIKTVLISGAAGGLGRALVKIFTEKGYHVLAADIKEINLTGFEMQNKLIPVTLDVTRPDQIAKLAKDQRLETDGLDILVSAAGIYDTYPLTEADPEQFKRMMDVNLHGTVNLVRGLLGALMKRNGRVVVVSSESYRIMAMFQPYMVTKASLEAYCRAARQELALKGIKMTVIRPGAINTPLLDWMHSPGKQEQYPVYSLELAKSWKRSVNMVGKIAPPGLVAEKIFKAATARRPKRIYRINNSKLLYLVALLPACLFDYILIRLFRQRMM